ncbi:Pentapeptide repeats (8 copies) [Micromonospora matsumotoense]|uniref:Pentapeptide repeats (8 copies) n=1 Tax=Micromonospora matsumotoense TaxID=121616 RepID=A0A1C5AT89_9ACTN|nr:hypothetical protein [Micromonospora matsumotoense]SCF48448.1 Pentapeptide repeats (8 copies) [Micromonospora matsumotoense]
MARPMRKNSVLKLGGVGALAVLLLGGGLQLASAAENTGSSAAQTVNCPTVRDKLPAIPAAAAAGVERELANLDEEIARQNERLAKQAANPQGGANFINNAILGPLKSKRVAVLDRIEINFNRVGAQRPNLDSLATCGLNAPGVASALNSSVKAGNAGTGANTTAAAQTVNCPTPQIPAVPAQAAANVQAELANLNKQISEANARLAQQAANPQGGANFINNAILGPLKDKRQAALDRIEIAFNRVGAQRPNLDNFAACGLNGAGAGNAGAGNAGAGNAGAGNAGAGNAGAGNAGAGNSGAARTVNCPTPQIPAVPAQAAANVQAELANLNKQISEANARLAQQAANPQGGANFINNAILGPLKDKRQAALDRIEIAFNRVGAQRPNLDNFAACGLN